MFFWRKKPKRLYYPVKSNWYTRPRHRPDIRRSKFFKGGISGIKRFLQKSFYFVLLIGFFVLILIFLAFSSYFSIKNIEVVRENFNVDSAGIENELNQYIGRNIIFFSKDNIYKTIQKKFPEFANISVSKVFPSTITIQLESQPIIANLRAYYILPEPEIITETSFTELNKAIEDISGVTSDIKKTEIQSSLDNKKIIESAFTLDENKAKPKPVEQKCLLNRVGLAICDQKENLELMTITIKGLTKPVSDREQIIPAEHMDFILGSLQYIKNILGIDILTVEYLQSAKEIHLKTQNNLVLWVSLDRDYKEQIDKLNTIYKAAELYKEDLAYIDLRVKEKVIYCPRHATCDKY